MAIDAISMYYGYWRYKYVLRPLTLYVCTTAIDAITMYYGYWRYNYVLRPLTL